MKKFFYSLFAAATMLFATTSCTEDEIVSQDGNEVNVSFTVQTNGTTGSRAIADGVDVGKGNMANTLVYAVYEDGNSSDVLIQNTVEETEEGKFTVTIPLAKNITYDIVFFAYNEEGNAFGITKENARTINLQELKLNEKLLANEEAYDAFFKTVNDYSPSAGNTTVTLNRPFAQLNAGTTLQDLADAADLDVVVTNSKIVVKKAHNQFNAFTGEATGETELEYTSTPILTTTSEAVKQESQNGASFEFKNETFNVKGEKETFYYLSLAYVLACDEKELYDVDVTFYRNTDDEVNTLSIPNLNLQRNYRTNIIGNLLTSKETFKVVIDPIFAEKEYNYTAWAGGVKEVAEVDGVYNIALAEELAWIAQEVNAGNNSFEGKTVKLISNIDLKNIAWTTIGLNGDAVGFKGTFEGEGHIISNLYIDQTATPAYQAAGLFGSVRGTLNNFTVKNAVIKNLSTGSATVNGTAVIAGCTGYGATITNVTVEDAEVYANRMVGGIAGYAAGEVSNCTVKNIKLVATPDDLDKDGAYDNGDKVGGIIGTSNTPQTLLTNNTVENITIIGYRDLGGIAGAAHKAAEAVKNNQVKGGSVVADMVSYDCGKTKNDANVGTIIGRILSNTGDTVDASNVATNVTTDIITGTASEPTYDDNTKTYIVKTADEWMWFSEKSDLEDGVTIDIKQDINLAGQTFKAICVKRSASLIVKGNGNTISNVKVISGNNDNTTGQASIFYVYPNSEITISDLTFDNVNVKADINGSGYAAVVIGYCEGKATLTNVDVKNSTVYGEKSCGAIAGHVSKDTDITMDGCNVTNCNIEVKEDRAGGLIGRVQGAATITNSTVDDATAQTESAPYSRSLVAPDGWANKYIGQRHEDCTSLTIDGAEYFDDRSSEALATYLMNEDATTINVLLGTDVECYLNKGIGGANTSSINIAATNKNNVLNITCPSASYNGSYATFRAVNENTVMKFSNITLDKSKWDATTWNTYNIEFYTDVDLNNCIIEHPVTFCRKAVATKTDFDVDETIHNQNTFYTIWQQANGTDVTLENCTVKGNRGIKIDEQYITAAPSKLTANNVTFTTTGSKSAILVKSSATTNITLNNVDITNVVADSENAVWVDEDATEHFDLAIVTGGNKVLERKVAFNADDLIAALESGKDVYLIEDIKIDPAGMSNAYGTTGINVKNGQTINGNGHILDIKGAGGTWDSGINTTGGLITDITVTGSFRGIFINHNSEHSEEVVLNNVIIDGTTYTISCDQGSNQNLSATNCIFNGWTSYAATIGNVKFTDCKFGEGNGYAFCRPYAPTEFIGCDFETGFQIDARAEVTFENCTLGGVALTADNLATLVTYNTANATVK